VPSPSSPSSSTSSPVAPPPSSSSSSSLVAIRQPILVWGSQFWFGDPQTKTGIPKPKWGCESQESLNRFGDPRTEMGIKTSPYQNGDARTNMGIVQSLTHTNMGFIPIWGPTELIPKLERHSKWGPHIGMGIPISVWVGICQYSKSGSPHTNMGLIPIWGPTYAPSADPFGRGYPRRIGCIQRYHAVGGANGTTMVVMFVG
jgi:hypothetical protein